MSKREAIRASVDWARDLHHDISERDAMRRFAANEFDDLDEAMGTAREPAACTDEDVDAVVAAWPEQAARLREYAEAHRGVWSGHVVERWLVRAEEIEDRVQQAGAQC